MGASALQTAAEIGLGLREEGRQAILAPSETQLEFEVAPATAQEMSMLGALIERSHLYRTGSDYRHLLDFMSRMRHMAPFNATLLHVQKPGIMFAATEKDWRDRYNRTVKEGARPLLILWPFAPVALVYDVEDTVGDALPLDVAAPFRAQGNLTDAMLIGMSHQLQELQIDWIAIPYGAGGAGHVRVTGDLSSNSAGKPSRRYAIRVNSRHDPNVQFATLVHELGHLFLGHLGHDDRLKISSRENLKHDQEELEAEMVSHLVCERQGVRSNAESYLSAFLKRTDTVQGIDINAIARAAHRVEVALGLSAQLSIGVDRPSHRPKPPA